MSCFNAHTYDVYVCMHTCLYVNLGSAEQWQVHSMVTPDSHVRRDAEQHWSVCWQAAQTRAH